MTDSFESNNFETPTLETTALETPTIGKSSVVALISYLMSKGLSKSYLADHFGKLLALIEDQDARVSLPHYIRLWRCIYAGRLRRHCHLQNQP